MSFFAAVILAVQVYPKWVWWTPPKSVDSEARLGFSEAKILRMGRGAWADYVYSQSEENRNDSIAFEPDGATIVYGVCKRKRNDRLLAKTKNPELYRALRNHLVLFGMACIALEDTLGGGGTYSVHEPRFMWSTEEEELGALIQNQAAGSSPPLDWSRYQNRLSVYRHFNKRIGTLVGGPLDLKELHLYADRTGKELEFLRSLSNQLPAKTRGHVGEFIQQYLFEYLNVRQADEAVLKP